jgi:hypothetical protein
MRPKDKLTLTIEIDTWCRKTSKRSSWGVSAPLTSKLWAFLTQLNKTLRNRRCSKSSKSRLTRLWIFQTTKHLLVLRFHLTYLRLGTKETSSSLTEKCPHMVWPKRSLWTWVFKFNSPHSLTPTKGKLNQRTLFGNLHQSLEEKWPTLRLSQWWLQHCSSKRWGSKPWVNNKRPNSFQLLSSSNNLGNNLCLMSNKRCNS